jgi:phosphatidylglycerophosphate synthase
MTFYKNRDKFKGFSLSIGRAFSRVGITPNQWTMISLIPVLIAVYVLTQGMFVVAGLLFILSSFLDLVDGAVARQTNNATKLGAYLDTVVDRYVEVIIIFGILLAGIPGFFIPSYAWIFLYLFGGLMTTYSKAAAKEKEIIPKGRELKGGLLERAERLLILFIGMLAAGINPVYLTYVIALLAILTNVSALQRIGIAYGMAKNE